MTTLPTDSIAAQVQTLRAPLVSTLDAPAHVTLERIFEHMKDRVTQKRKTRVRTGSKRDHFCNEHNCVLLGRLSSDTMAALQGFENELPVSMCREKIISDAVDNVDMHIRAVSAVDSTDLDIHDPRHLHTAPTDEVDASVQGEKKDGAARSSSNTTRDQANDSAAVFEIPTVMNSPGAIAERRSLSRAFYAALDDCGLVPIAYRESMSEKILKEIGRRVAPAEESSLYLDTSAITAGLAQEETMLPVRVLTPVDGILTLYLCNLTQTRTWVFEPTSVEALGLQQAGYRFQVYCPRGPLAHWAPQLNAFFNAGSRMSGTQDANVPALASGRNFALRTPKHLAYPRYVEYAQALIDARRARSYTSYPVVITETKHDLKQLESMSVLERNQLAAAEAQRERLIMEGRRVSTGQISNVMNPLLGSQLVPGALVNVSTQFSELDYRRRVGDVEDQYKDQRMTSYFNSAHEATIGTSNGCVSHVPLSARGMGDMAQINPTPGEPVSIRSKQLSDNCYVALSAMIQQSSNVPVLVQPRLNAHLYSLPRESTVAHVSPPVYTGPSEEAMYQTFRAHVLEAYHVPRAMAQAQQQGQWGLSRNIPVFGSLSKSVIAASFNIESRGYGDFISKMHEEAQQFFLWLYDTCLRSLDGQLIQTIVDRELKKSKKTHDQLVDLVQQYSTAWHAAEVADVGPPEARMQSDNPKQADLTEHLLNKNLVDAPNTRPFLAARPLELRQSRARPIDAAPGVLKRKQLMQNLQDRLFAKHRQYAGLTQYLYFLSLASHGRTSIKFEFMPSKRYMDNIEIERENLEYQIALKHNKTPSIL